MKDKRLDEWLTHASHWFKGEDEPFIHPLLEAFAIYKDTIEEICSFSFGDEAAQSRHVRLARECREKVKKILRNEKISECPYKVEE